MWVASARPCGAKCLQKFASRTLLFQPDATLYCWQQGGGCPLRNTEPHCSHYLHTLPPHAAVAPAPLAVVNDPTLRFAVPGVRRAWALPEDAVADTLTGASPLTVPSLSGRRVVLYVHGFRQGFRRTMGCVSNLNDRLGGRRAVPEGAAGAEGAPQPGSDTAHACVMAFLWPAHHGKLAYARARGKTERAGAELRRVIAALRKMGCEVVVYAHSLGCRVALAALRDLPPPNVPHLFLAAAAVPQGALGPDGEFPRRRVAADRITVFHSRNDDTLRDGFQLGERWASWGVTGDAALGLGGPQPPLPVFQNEVGPPDGASVDVVDVTQAVSGHSPHLFLVCEQVWRRVAGALGVTPEEGELASASGLGADDDGVESDEDDGDGGGARQFANFPSP